MIAPERPVTETPIGFSLRWEGIEVVQDDLGYHYLICQRRYQVSGSGLSRFTGVLEMLCSPSVMPDAGFLHVSGSDQALVVLSMLPGEPETQRRALDEIPIGNWSFTFPLGSRPA